MKKTLIILVLLLLCMGLCACGTEKVPKPSVSTLPTQEAVPTPDPTPTPVPTPTPTPVPPADRSAEYIYDANPELTKVRYDSPALLGLTEDAGTEYTDQLYFICDSPTYWMKPNGLLGGGKDTKQIWTGPEGTQTLAYQSTYCIVDPWDGKEKPIREVVELHKPEYIVIALGINGISFMDEEYFTEEYMDLVVDIQTISPDTKLILQSIYPITPDFRNWGSITNEMITEGNSWILKIAEQTGCKYLDSFSAILGEDGNAKAEYMKKDGLHPNKEGLEQILLYIRTHAWLPEE